ncbi:MinD/ParA family ATP-binding protein [Salinactinospora qingdaonensis]
MQVHTGRRGGEVTVSDTRGDTLLHRVGRSVLRAFRPADEVLAAVAAGQALQRPITTGRRIVVTGPRDEVGRSTLAALLAMTFAHYRRDRVLAVDAAAGTGTLASRLGVRPRVSLGDLVDTAIGAGGFDDVEPHLAGVRERLWVLPSERANSRGGRLGDHTYSGTVLPLTRFFGLTLVNCGSDMFDGINRAAMLSAHAYVMVESATREGAASMSQVIDRMVAVGNRASVERTLVVFVAGAARADAGFDFAATAERIRNNGAEVTRVGYDRHLAETTAIDPRRLAESTHTAVTRAAGEALRLSM